MRPLILVLSIALVGCGVEPLLPPHLVDVKARCGHLRKDNPAVFPDCIRSVEFGNLMRIESRQRYLRRQAEDSEPTPMYVSPPPYVPQPLPN